MTNSLKTPWGDSSKRQIHYTHLLRTKTSSRFSPYLGGGIVGKLTPALLPVRLTRGLGWGWGWLGPPLVSVPANARAGSGVRGQPLHMTSTYTP
jgi:hypothetical protein